MIPYDKDGHRPLLARARRRHIGPPPRIDRRGDDRPLRGFRSMRMRLPCWRQQRVGTPQAQDPARRRAGTAMPQSCPPLAVAFAWEGRRLQNRPSMAHQCLVRTGAAWSGTGAHARTRLPLPIGSRPHQPPDTTDTGQAVGCAWTARGPDLSARPPQPHRAASLQAGPFLPQQLIGHGGFA
jgi:hypothetical protein